MKTPRFFEEPILNSPYEYPGRHWILDKHRRPTGEIEDERRAWDGYRSPIPPTPEADDRTMHPHDYYDAQAAEFDKLGRVPVLKARMKRRPAHGRRPEEHRERQPVRHLGRARHRDPAGRGR